MTSVRQHPPPGGSRVAHLTFLPPVHHRRLSSRRGALPRSASSPPRSAWSPTRNPARVRPGPPPAGRGGSGSCGVMTPCWQGAAEGPARSLQFRLRGELASLQEAQRATPQQRAVQPLPLRLALQSKPLQQAVQPLLLPPPLWQRHPGKIRETCCLLSQGRSFGCPTHRLQSSSSRTPRRPHRILILPTRMTATCWSRLKLSERFSRRLQPGGRPLLRVLAASRWRQPRGQTPFRRRQPGRQPRLPHPQLNPSINASCPGPCSASPHTIAGCPRPWPAPPRPGERCSPSPALLRVICLHPLWVS